YNQFGGYWRFPGTVRCNRHFSRLSWRNFGEQERDYRRKPIKFKDVRVSAILVWVEPLMAGFSCCRKAEAPASPKAGASTLQSQFSQGESMNEQILKVSA